MSGADERGEGLEIGGEVGGGCVVCLFLLKKVKYGRDQVETITPDVAINL